MISAVITCAGNHTRFGKNKLLEDLEGKPVFIRTIEQFNKSREVSEIIASVREEYLKTFRLLLKKAGLKVKLVVGGDERYISAYHGAKVSRGKFILIHDGARPLVSVNLINNIAKEVKKHKAVIAACRPFTCIKKGKGFFVDECLERAETWVAQTPQAYKKEIIIKAYKKAIDNKELNGMDDCELVSSLGVKVRVVAGEENNIKITFPSDLAIARSLYRIKNGGK